STSPHNVLLGRVALGIGRAFAGRRRLPVRPLLRKPNSARGIGTDNGLGDNLPEVRSQQARKDADGYLPVFLRVYGLRRHASPQSGRLLRVLFLRFCKVPLGATRQIEEKLMDQKVRPSPRLAPLPIDHSPELYE